MYTNRNHISSFIIDVSEKITNDCDKDRKCIVTVDLSSSGYLCSDNTCVQKLEETDFFVGEYINVLIFLLDSSYKKRLKFIKSYINLNPGTDTNVIDVSEITSVVNDTNFGQI